MWSADFDDLASDPCDCLGYGHVKLPNECCSCWCAKNMLYNICLVCCSLNCSFLCWFLVGCFLVSVGFCCFPLRLGTEPGGHRVHHLLHFGFGHFVRDFLEGVLKDLYGFCGPNGKNWQGFVLFCFLFDVFTKRCLGI